MKPAKFEYFRPENLTEATRLLGQYGDEASLLAGGQSLLPLLSMRLARPAVIIDLNRLAELDYLREDGDWLAIGALTRQRATELSPLVARLCPLVQESIKLIGHLPIRNRGTIGGNIAHADPASELPATLQALNGLVVLVGPEGERAVTAADFFLTVLTTSRSAVEMVKEVRFPRLPLSEKVKAGYAFYEVSRQQGNYAMAGAAVYLELDGQGYISAARLGLCSVAPIPLKAAAAEQILVGEKPSPALFKEAGRLAAQVSDPASDLHAEADYRRALAGVVTERALARALARSAKGGAEARPPAPEGV